MCEACGHVQNRSNRSDPTHTYTIRNKWKSNLSGRYNIVKREVKQTIIDNNYFGLNRRVQNESLTDIDGAFLTDEQKIERFNRWLKSRLDKNLLSSDNQVSFRNTVWQDRFITSAYISGLKKAHSQLKQLNVIDDEEPEPNIYSNKPRDKKYLSLLGLLLLKGRNEIEGINNAVIQQVSREVVTEIAVEAPKPRIVNMAVQNLIDKVGKERAEMMAETLTVEAFNKALLDSYVSYGIQKVGATVEWVTAGDAKVCPICKSFEGRIFDISEAYGMIPAHPRCRCMWSPIANVEDVSALYDMAE